MGKGEYKMRKIKVYDELSIYAKRLLDYVHDPAWCGFDYDVWENDNGVVIRDDGTYTEYNNIDDLDYALSKAFVDFVINEIKATDVPYEISDAAKHLVI